MKFARIYELLIRKAERKGRQKAEVDALITWLLGYDEEGIRRQLERDTDYETFIGEAPSLNPSWQQITGKICGVRIETIADATMRKIRCLDKLIDELARGKTLDKLRRQLSYKKTV